MLEKEKRLSIVDAIIHNNIDFIDNYISLGLSLNHRAGSGDSLLDLCIVSGNLSTFIKIVEAGGDISSFDKDKKNLYLKSVMYERYDILKYLVSLNDDSINSNCMKTLNKYSILDYAVSKKMLNIIAILIDSKKLDVSSSKESILSLASNGLTNKKDSPITCDRIINILSESRLKSR